MCNTTAMTSRRTKNDGADSPRIIIGNESAHDASSSFSSISKDTAATTNAAIAVRSPLPHLPFDRDEQMKPSTSCPSLSSLSSSAAAAFPSASTKTRKQSSKSEGEETLLSEDFKPSPYSVIIGRGKRIRETTGNRRLRVLASSQLQRYADAMDNKTAKTQIVNSVVNMIREACPVGAFVRRKDGRWWEAHDAAAREKCGYVFRDLLHDRYESSSKSKVAKRKQQQQQQQDQYQSDGIHDQLAQQPQPTFSASNTDTARMDCRNSSNDSGMGPGSTHVAATSSTTDMSALLLGGRSRSSDFMERTRSASSFSSASTTSTTFSYSEFIDDTFDPSSVGSSNLYGGSAGLASASFSATTTPAVRQGNIMLGRYRFYEPQSDHRQHGSQLDPTDVSNLLRSPFFDCNIDDDDDGNKKDAFSA